MHKPEERQLQRADNIANIPVSCWQEWSGWNKGPSDISFIKWRYDSPLRSITSMKHITRPVHHYTIPPCFTSCLSVISNVMLYDVSYYLHSCPWSYNTDSAEARWVISDQEPPLLSYSLPCRRWLLSAVTFSQMGFSSWQPKRHFNGTRRKAPAVGERTENTAVARSGKTSDWKRIATMCSYVQLLDNKSVWICNRIHLTLLIIKNRPWLRRKIIFLICLLFQILKFPLLQDFYASYRMHVYWINMKK